MNPGVDPHGAHGSDRAVVAVIAKEPVAGRVKTRLVPPLDHAEAARVAAASLSDTCAAVDAAFPPGAGVRRILYFEGDPEGWLPAGWDLLEQCGGGLGDRLDHLFALLRAPAVVVGMDTPQLGAGSLRSALESLCRPGVDAVLGPAADGGYWTIGFSSYVPGAFDGVPMSESVTGEAQRRRLGELGLSVAHLGSLLDIDHWEDAFAVATEHPHLATAEAVRSAACWPAAGAAGPGGAT